MSMWNRGIGVAMVVTGIAAAAACDPTVQGPVQEAGNVEVRVGASVSETDSAVVVDGHPVIRFPGNHAAFWLDRFERFTWGGFPELGYPQAERHALSWRARFAHGEEPEVRSDSVIFRYFDHGAVTLGDTAMNRLADEPHVGPGTPVRFETYVAYILGTYVRVRWDDGTSTDFVRASVHDDLAAGRPVPFSTAGSDDIEPLDAVIAVRPFATLRSIENRGPLDLEAGMPILDTDRPLVLEFDRPFDPDRAFVFLVPFHGQPGGTRVFVQPRTATQRVVIPPHVLRKVSGDDDGTAAFIAIVVEFLVEDGVVTGRFRAGGAEFALPFVQRGETTLHFRARRGG